uniref:Uncharacterized protein n=1 Tax=Opuntia streptacantha TaxID=393608 RepID=A0A7C9EPS2_OPUST
MSSNMLCVTPPLPILIWRLQSLCRYFSTSSATSCSIRGSPNTLFLCSSHRSRSPPPSTGAQVPVHFRSSRPGPNGENLGGSRNPIGSTAGSDSEYEYRKSKGKSDFTGKLWAFWEFRGSFSLLILGLGGFAMGEKGGSSASE